MKLKFSDEQFYAILCTSTQAMIGRDAAFIAQQIYNDYVAKCPVAYKVPNLNGPLWQENTDDISDSTHRARLIEVEEIEKKECEHKAAAPTAAAGIYFCIECDKKLKWTVVDE